MIYIKPAIMDRFPSKPLTQQQTVSLILAKVSSGVTENECGICCEVFTHQRRKPISCNACDYVACNKCYKTFLTSDGVSRPKCMNPKCNTEWTTRFLKDHFNDSFISGELREHFSKILYQQQIAMLPATQPAVERQILNKQYQDEITEIALQIRALTARKSILHQDIRVLARGGGLAESEVASTFQHKCCDPECRGFVSSAWKCGVCSKFSCAHCHEVKGKTTQEIDEHVCNPENVETIKLLRLDTKPCPECGVYIYKTEGCDQMFCVSCKQLWSWKTGRIEERGHNPHYLDWMRSRNGGEMMRDPADIQCGREIDWRFDTAISRQFGPNLVDDQDVKLSGNICDNYRRIVSQWSQSVIHVRQHDIPYFRNKMEIRQELEKLRIQLMLKQISETHFRQRNFQIHRNAEVNRQIVDLLVAIQNAATDILYRLHDQLCSLSSTSVVQINTFLQELTALRSYAIQCVTDIYVIHDKKVTHTFARENSLALYVPW